MSTDREREALARLRLAAELAYSEMAFTLHDIADPRRRVDDEAWIERRGKTLAERADALRAALGTGDAER